MMFRKGQVSTEYLVILAVVLVVALVVVALVSGMSPLSTGVSASQSANYWAGVSPFAITAWKFSSTAPLLTMTIQNQAGQQVTLKSISSTTGANTFTSNIPTPIVFAVGQIATVNATTSASCSGTFDFPNVVLTYDQGGITDLHQNGAKDMVGSCS
jgi:uncharacterized protein (UPF0333 family)